MCVNPMIMLPSIEGRYKYIGQLMDNPEFKLEPPYITVPCGHCIECRLKKANEWALRCVHEASRHTHNCFLTLTYSDDYLPANGSLIKKHLQDFMKRLRKRYSDKKIRFLGCGEYGTASCRPHYHLLLFGFFPDDARKISNLKSGYNLFTSPTISELWPFGFNSFGAVTFESARYVAQYSLKKQYGKAAPEFYKERGVIPEFINVSNRKGIGYDVVLGDINGSNSFFERGFCVLNGVKFSIPRYYEKVLEQEVPDYFASYKVKKIERAQHAVVDPARLASRNKILAKKCENFRHQLDNIVDKGALKVL